uniref:Uncharacterized protein n=1 Tax=Anguilla anguilla TaxID=7936 RepID=A0A0E9W9Z7_ANGAN
MKWITGTVAYHIAGDMVPTVEKAGFNRPLKTIDSEYQLPSQLDLQELIFPKLQWRL